MSNSPVIDLADVERTLPSAAKLKPESKYPRNGENEERVVLEPVFC